MHAKTVLGERKGVLIREVSSCMQKLFLGKEKVSLLERCPYLGLSKNCSWGKKSRPY